MNKLTKILLIIMSLITTVASGFAISFAVVKNTSVIKLVENGEEITSLEVNEVLYQGVDYEHKIELSSNASIYYELSLIFEGQANTFSDCVELIVRYDCYEIKDTLSSLLKAGSKEYYTINLRANEPEVITFIYRLKDGLLDYEDEFIDFTINFNFDGRVRKR